MATTILAYFQKGRDGIEEYKSLGGESGICLVAVDGKSEFFICWVWKNGNYTRPCTTQRGITVTSTNPDYLAKGAMMYKKESSARAAIKRLLMRMN
jgi:hypothetical protein